MKELDLRETGRDAQGKPIHADQRLFMQLLAFGNCTDTAAAIDSLEASGLYGTLYADLNDPHGIALVTASKRPDYFTGRLRGFLNTAPFSRYTLKQELTMFGRTYAIGYEANLDHVLVQRPLTRLLNPATPWAIWYPVRRKSSFARLSPEEQRSILGEHGQIGAAFSAKGYGQDIRLASYGLDKADNDFVIGLIGADLFRLSAMVQTMRTTRQTAEYLENLGPFFIGHAVWMSDLPSRGPT